MAKKLLIIDQNLAVQRLVEFTLGKEGFEIVAVEDGLSGLDSAFQTLPDLIMVNAQLEGLPLNVFIQKLRERIALKATPIILMAQSSDELNLDQLRRVGITDVIKKPLDAMEITAIVTRCLPSAEPVAVQGKTASSAAAKTDASASAPSSSSTEGDQDSMQIEQLLGWVPKEQDGGASGTKKTKPSHADAHDAPIELERNEDVQPATSPSKEPSADAFSLEDMLITGAEAMHYQPPMAEEPPPPPPPAATTEPPELEELLAPQGPPPVKPQERKAPIPSITPTRLSAPAAATPTTGLSLDETENLIRTMVEELTRKLAQETIERVTKEIVPELAERAVRAEIDRLKTDPSLTD